MISLTGKRILVTGGSRGIGRATAVALAEVVANMIGASASMEEHGSEVEADVRAPGRHFTGYVCDFGDRATLYELIDPLKIAFPVLTS